MVKYDLLVTAGLVSARADRAELRLRRQWLSDHGGTGEREHGDGGRGEPHDFFLFRRHHRLLASCCRSHCRSNFFTSARQQHSDTGYEETGHRGLGFIFSSIRSAHFMLAR
jgi:hypothetical protein